MWSSLYGEPRTGAVKEVAAVGRGRSPWRTMQDPLQDPHPTANPSARASGEWGQQLWALSFFSVLLEEGRRMSKQVHPQSVWVVVEFRACEQPRALFLFTHLFPDSPPPMLNVLPCPGSVSVQLLSRMLSFPHLQSFFGSRTILLGKH